MLVKSATNTKKSDAKRSRENPWQSNIHIFRASSSGQLSLPRSKPWNADFVKAMIMAELKWNCLICLPAKENPPAPLCGQKRLPLDLSLSTYRHPPKRDRSWIWFGFQDCAWIFVRVAAITLMHLGILFLEAEWTVPNCVGWSRVRFLEEILQIRERMGRWKTELVIVSRRYSGSCRWDCRITINASQVRLLIVLSIQNTTNNSALQKSYTSREFELVRRIDELLQSRRNNYAQRSPSRLLHASQSPSKGHPKSLPRKKFNMNQVRSPHSATRASRALL
jgi:hypothetical protein